MPEAEKRQLRRTVSTLRRDLPAEFRLVADAALAARLQELPEIGAADLVAAFVSDGSEPDLQVFIEEFSRRGCIVFLPRSYQTAAGLEYEMAAVRDFPGDLVRGSYGIMEPRPGCRKATAEELARMIWLVPGVAFDLSGRRLGRGKGFYDRLLQGGHGLKVGIFYECQKVAQVPVEPHDFPLDAVVTEYTIYRFNK